MILRRVRSPVAPNIIMTQGAGITSIKNVVGWLFECMWYSLVCVRHLMIDMPCTNVTLSFFKKLIFSLIFQSMPVDSFRQISYPVSFH